MVKLAIWRVGLQNTRVSLAQSGPAQSALRPPATLAITSRSSLPSARMRTSRLRAS